MSEHLRAAAERLARWIKEDAVPLWSTQGLMPNKQINYDRLLANGSVDFESNVRARVQARQAFFFAVAAERGWCDQGIEIAQGLLLHMQTYGAHPMAGAGYVHLMDKNLNIIDSKQDIYEHAFFVLANAWVYRVSGDITALKEAEKIVAHLDLQFGSLCGGWVEGDYAYDCRRQNPHMHLFEAFLALYDATGRAKWLARASEIFTLFQTRFFDAKKQVLFEFFDENWNRCDNAKGEEVEPGHMMEWVWLLDWYNRCTGRPVAQYTSVLYNKALAIGMDKSGLLFDVVAADGRVINPYKRCWAMTELIKASLVQIRAGHPQAEHIAITAVNNLFDYYLCATTPGSYVDQRGAQNEVVVDTAPASTLYHLIVAAVELIDHCERVA